MANAAAVATIVADGGRGTGGGAGYYRQLWQVFNSEAVANSTSTVESLISSTINGFDPAEFSFFGIWAKVDTTATVSVNYNLLESWDDTSGNYVAPNAGGTIAAAVTTTAAQVFVVTPTPMPKMRLQAAGSSMTATDVRITLYLFMVHS